jgi:hypothetical protein
MSNISDIMITCVNTIIITHTYLLTYVNTIILTLTHLCNPLHCSPLPPPPCIRIITESTSDSASVKCKLSVLLVLTTNGDDFGAGNGGTDCGSHSKNGSG